MAGGRSQITSIGGYQYESLHNRQNQKRRDSWTWRFRKDQLDRGYGISGGITSRLGNVTEGNTISDFDKEEIKRKFSISTSMVPVIWNDVKVNVLDTPGYFDFVGEAEEAAAAADAAVIVVSGKNGVEVGTQKAWALCEKYKLPRMFLSLTWMWIMPASAKWLRL